MLKPARPPDTKELRKFALAIAIGVVGVFGLLAPYLLEREFPRWPWIVAAVWIVWAWVAPRSLIVAYRPWMALSLFLGKVNAWIVLSILFFTVVTPVAWVLRLLRHDAMHAKRDPGLESYRVDSRAGHVPPKIHMTRPF